MKAYGYENDAVNTEDFLVLKDVTLECSVEELQQIIKFLNLVYEQFTTVKREGWCHRHYRDWDKNWTKKHCDIIITTDFGEETSED